MNQQNTIDNNLLAGLQAAHDAKPATALLRDFDLALLELAVSHDNVRITAAAVGEDSRRRKR